MMRRPTNEWPIIIKNIAKCFCSLFPVINVCFLALRHSLARQERIISSRRPIQRERERDVTQIDNTWRCVCTRRCQSRGLIISSLDHYSARR